MCLEIISLAENEGGKSAPGLLNWKLNDVLLSSSSTAAVILPAARAGDRSLLEFLAEWTERFTKANKQLYLVPQNGKLPDKKPAGGRRKGTHPAFALRYAASVAELKKAMFFDPEPPAGAPAGETMAVGATVTASAEYVCTACGKARMWLKGDSARACDNLECTDAQAGWRMTFLLF
jgi:hypothetical protein